MVGRGRGVTMEGAGWAMSVRRLIREMAGSRRGKELEVDGHCSPPCRLARRSRDIL